ncbi:BnaUnng01360D [Brassica napus]|uniref:BnaUnng01360D protein n=1 Tax=Brassica napus TaxID=3708 RepID=A0A078JHL9_BRANA|nr:BnaUnng01360D [Brassica napus]
MLPPSPPSSPAVTSPGGKHLVAGGGSKTQEVVMLPLSINRLRGRAVSVCPART